MKIRTLRADEIEARVQTVKKNGCSVLLYKDARCDMNVLDEVFGIGNWQRSHEVINGNLFCNVGIRFDRENGFGEWVWKQDVGTESFTEKEKGQASDSFKRACFNWGIGRELYTAPFIWINLTDKDISEFNGKVSVKTKFEVSKIEYNDKREIIALEIKDDKGKVRYTLGKVTLNPNEQLDEKYKKNNTNASVDANNTTTNTTNTDSSNNAENVCSLCSTEVKPAVKTYSERFYGRSLCIDCQNKNAKIG